MPLAGNGGTTLTVDDTTNGHLLGGLVVMLGQVTNKAIQLQRAVTWLRDVFGTTDATSSKVTRGQLCLAARFLRTGTTDELNAMDCLIWRTICDPISEEDVDSCKETLKSDAVSSAVRRNLENRQRIIHRCHGDGPGLACRPPS